jgi:hypothetical protein
MRCAPCAVRQAIALRIAHRAPRGAGEAGGIA